MTDEGTFADKLRKLASKKVENELSAEEIDAFVELVKVSAEKRARTGARYVGVFLDSFARTTPELIGVLPPRGNNNKIKDKLIDLGLKVQYHDIMTCMKCRGDTCPPRGHYGYAVEW